MNDFTKEELEQLYHCAKFVTEYNWLHDRFDRLMKKVQFMIDHFDTPVIPVWHCEKCGHVQ